MRSGQDGQTGGSGIPVEVELTARGFRQTADKAMGHDPLRGLIETITNADDAYGDNEGPILIRLPKSRTGEWSFTTADRASGIAHQDMRKKLLKLGGRTSGHERGESKRGNRGRGAKDLAAFGMVRWDSIHDGQYAWLELGSDAKGWLAEKPVRATAELRNQLGIPRNGTVVTVTWQRTRVTRPQKNRLKQRLERCVPLRDIMLNGRRDIKLQYGEESRTQLRYMPPAGIVELEQVQVPVDGYPGLASIRIQEVPTPFNEDPGDLCREGGLLVKSGRAVHEATLFTFEGNPYAGSFLGEVRWDTIDDLSREYDGRDERGEPHSPENDRAIISVDRDGLDQRHPAYKALKKSVDAVLKKHFDRKADDARGGGKESAETRRRLSDLARIIARFTTDKAEELELEDPLRYTSTGRLDPRVPDLAVIPPAKVLEHGKQHTFTVQVREDALLGATPTVHLTVVADPDPLIQLSIDEVELSPSDSHPGVVRGTFRVTAGRVNGQACVEAMVAGLGSTTVDITVIEPAVVLPPEAPLTFMFERSQYILPSGGKKTVLLLAPTAAVENHGMIVRLNNSNPQGVLIRHMQLELSPSRDGDWYQAPIELEGRQHGAKATLAAHLGSGPLKARTNITVGRALAGPPIPEIKIAALPGYQRGSWDVDDDGHVTITVNATHVAAQRYFGLAPNFPGQESVACRLIIAEIASDLVVRDILMRRHQSREVDVVSIFTERARMMAELLPSCHLALLSDSEVGLSAAAAVEDETSGRTTVAGAGHSPD